MPSSQLRLKFGAFATALLGLAIASHAAPIRIGILKGTGPSRYWHTSIHTSSSAIISILANPEQANLGPNLILPPNGFIVTEFGVGTGGQAPTTTGSPSTAQLADFINALDTLDVVWIPNFVDIGGSIKDTNQRKRFDTFIRTKGFISTHHNNDSYGSWTAWDSLHGARMQNHPSSDRTATLRMDSLPGNKSDPAFAFLNAGLLDTNFIEEWSSYTKSGNMIRSISGLRVTFTLDESTMNGGTGGMLVMGDHPISWYRFFPDGGRFFYTAIGHRTQNYTGGTNPRFLRRQLYNAILWAAGVDSNGVVAVQPAKHRSPAAPIKTWVTGNRIHVKVAEANSRVELYSLNGTRLLFQDSKAPGTVSLNKPPQSGTFIVCIRNAHGIQSKLLAL